jgi:hypothetical protein
VGVGNAAVLQRMAVQGCPMAGGEGPRCAVRAVIGVESPPLGAERDDPQGGELPLRQIRDLSNYDRAYGAVRVTACAELWKWGATAL